MAAHKFWRILVHSNATDHSYNAIGEMDFLKDGSSVISGGTPFADKYASGYGPENVFDGNVSTYWTVPSSEGFPYSIGYEFSEETAVDTLTLQPTEDRQDRMPGEFEIQHSDDGQEWTTTGDGMIVSLEWGYIEIREFAVTTEPEASALASKVSGVVQIDGTPAERTVRAFSYSSEAHLVDGTEINAVRTLGHATSDPDTGEYTIDLLDGYGNEIFVVAFDDYGADFTPDLAVAVGDRVHPTTPNGHVWECSGAGTLPSEEPVWVIDTETSQTYGTAAMIARPFYRPMVHGPVMPEVTIVAVPYISARYWRLYATQNSTEKTDNTLAMFYFEFLDKDGNTIPTDSGADLFSSEANSSSNGADNPFDGTVETYWISGSGEALPQWIGYDFGSIVDVAEIVLKTGTNTYVTERMPFNFEIQWSSDGIAWQTAKEFKSSDQWVNSETRTYSLV